ncbi:MAG TPA: hypothetical protein VM689_07205 [Aliidongia sp.]|nr:hypothetical protein [Aliidongia sp.]
MRRNMKALVLGLAVIGGALATQVPARAADVTVGIGGGGIAFGFADGYWDRGHNWHAWQNKEEADRFRAENHDHYYAYKHDRDKDQGWHEGDHYWEHH